MTRLDPYARRLEVAVLGLAMLLLPVGASAQDVPSYALPVAVSTDETIHGRIASVDGAFTLSVDDDRGFVDSVRLHPGTIINPTGLALSSGMSVTIAGYNAGAVFDANEIDTPYNYSGALPIPAYYGPGYWCPGFAYGYGPSFSLAIIIGGGYGDHRFEHRPFHGRPWDGRRYFGDDVGRPYASRALIGERRGIRSEAVGERRILTADTRGASTHVPSAFAGRAFAGHSYSGGSYSAHSYGGSYAARSYGGSYPVRSYGGGTVGRSYAGGVPASTRFGGAGGYGRGISRPSGFGGTGVTGGGMHAGPTGARFPSARGGGRH